MATVRDVVSGALKLLAVRAAESPISAAEVEDGRVSLNDMMSEWEERNIHTGFVPLGDAEDELSVPDFAVGAIKAKLALYIAPEYDKRPSADLIERSRSSFTALRSALVRIRKSPFPDTLPVGSGNQLGYQDNNGDLPGIDSDDFYPENERRNF